MRKLVLMSIAILIAAGNVYSQATYSGMGFNIGTNLLFGDSPVKDSRLMPKLEAYSFYQATPNFTVKFQVGYGELKNFYGTGYWMKVKMIPIELIGRYALSNTPTFPFIQAGVGLMNWKINNGATKYDGLLIGGLGMNIPLNPDASFQISGDFRYATDDRLNTNDGGFFNDGIFSVQAGLSFNFGKNEKKYERKDSIPKSNIIADLPDPVPAQPSKSDIYLDLVKIRSRVDELEKEILDKTSRIEQLAAMLNTKEEDINRLETQIAELQNPTPTPQDVVVEQPTPQVVQATTPPVTSPTTTQPESASSPDDPAQIMQKYDIALANFNGRNYNAVIIGLSDLLENHPTHARASNFAYWIGESYFALKNYDEALKSFQKVSAYNNSSKLDFALYMEGRCLYNVGDNNTASQKFQELLQKYPSSSLAGKATNYIQKIQRKVIS